MQELISEMSEKSLRRKPEIMSPAGYWPQLRAAVEAGADAVYFGLKHFTARAKVGFQTGELPEVMKTLHQRGVRGYVTFNTLVFEHELEAAAKALAVIAEAGADALIVQDLGIVKLARQIVPDMELHASTQMSITNAQGVEFAKSFGLRRVTLARELSLEQIRAIAAETGFDLEIFVHGALCVSYSGQCFSSEAWGGRSANRGQCAQACRLPYELLVDGTIEPLADARYLLSPGDLFALRQLPEIVESGVAALKIEGRYKDADYVALTTRAYRQALDEAWNQGKVKLGRDAELQLEQVFSRGLGPYFLTGTNHQAVVQGRTPRHRGVCMGRVARVERDGIVIEPGEAHRVAPLKAGDGVVFDAADWRSPQEPEEGGNVYQVLAGLDGHLELRFGNGAIQQARIRPGDLVWRTHDPALDRVVKPLLEPSAPLAKQPVNVRVTAGEGAPLVSEWSLAKHPEIRATVISEAELRPAQNRGLSVETLRDQFGRLGNTPYELAELTLDAGGSLFAPASLLNQLRREAVEQLQAAQAELRPMTIADPVAVVQSALLGSHEAVAQGPAQLHLLVRTPEQMEAVIELRPASITLDYLDLYGLRPSIERVKASGIVARVASPRVLKPGEARIVDFLLSLDCAIVVRSTGLLEALRGKPHAALIGDFSLNAANSLSARVLQEQGVGQLTPTHDLNAAQVAALARDAGAESIEAIAYQHLPVFHTEHCVFCRFLSTGTSYKDCGRPCEKHRVALKDDAGRAHPVMADVGCRNTVFGAEAQAASAHLELWRSAGIRHFRLEFVHESAEDVRQITRAFEQALAGRWTAQQLARELKRIAPEGTTEGSLFVPEGYLTLPILQ
jgi:putative protease